MIKGENTDLYINGHTVHIQTEDWGAEQQVFVCRVFKNGSVLKTFKLPYSQVGPLNSVLAKQQVLNRFHQKIIDWSYQEI